ncbi:hypothetical protein FSP39_016553 [Pinctada imbricata]|uniref:Sorbitol dehydrogenase n=1 Tax=Pinctada imbricata TaxID=66713 RepID=A0AA88Y5P0_PINIB|nr:hypothetical protein FSP39_016553 [Pinctada imbricata]
MIFVNQITEVLVAVQRVGICGTDLEIWQQAGYHGDPINHTVPGHECSGIVHKVGKDVTAIKKGDRVAVFPVIKCGTCNLCTNGHGDVILCNGFKCLSLTNYQYGGMMRYLVHPENLVFRIPDNVSFEEGAIVEPLSVTLRACMKANIRKGDNVLIGGAGPIGICAMLNAKQQGASNVCIVDKNELRLDLAKKMGATMTYRVPPSDDVSLATRDLIALMGRRPDHAIETTGVQYPINLCIDAVEKGGYVVLVGLAEQHVTINAVDVVMRDIKVCGCVGPVERFPEVIEMISNGQIDVKPLITHHFGLTEVQKAFELCERKEGMKIMIDCANDAITN